MSKDQQCLDQSRLELFLNEQLDERDESTVLEHINTCSSCQQALENIAAGKEAWSELKNQLANHLDLDVTSETAPFQSKGRDVEMEKLKEYLGPTDNPDMLGRLGSYEVRGLVGRGSTGVVVKALDTRLNRFVAIKVLSPSFSSNGPARTRFEREGRSIAAVSHEHVVPIHSVNEYRGLPFIVMHYVDGGSLHQRIEKNGPLDTCEVVRIGMQIAKGLAAAHGQGIIHRDVKPANVMLETGIDRAMVSDFGLARVADEAAMTRSGVIAGTPQYMSPEQAMGDPVDPRSDLFSLGSVLYTACTGRPPFRSETVFGVIKRVCESSPRPIREINPKIDSWLEALIAKLHEKDREDRFESAEQVAGVFNRELAHLQSPSFVPEPARPWLTAVAPQKPVKEKQSLNLGWQQLAVAAAIVLLATLSALAYNGMLHIGPNKEISSLKSPGPNDENESNKNISAIAAVPGTTSQFRSYKAPGIVADLHSATSASASKVLPIGIANEVEIRIAKTSVSANCESCRDSTNCSGECDICEACEVDCDCVVDCDRWEADCQSVGQLVSYGAKGRAGQWVAVKQNYPGKIVDGYMLYLPISYDKTSQDYPVIVYLTGGCGVGGEISDLQCWGLPQTVLNELETGPVDLEDEHKKLMMNSFIVVAPHMNAGDFESRQFFKQEPAISKILDDVNAGYRVDEARVYLTGAGRGGHGTWGLASRMPKRFAAIAPIRGRRFGIDNYEMLAGMPIWVGHNTNDREVEFAETEAIISRLKNLDGKEFYSIDETASAGSYDLDQTRILTSSQSSGWPDLYASAPLFKWFLNHSRKPQRLMEISTKMQDSIPGHVFTSSGNDGTGFTVISKSKAMDKYWKTSVERDHPDAEEFESNIEKTIQVEPGGKLLLKTNLGHIKIRTIDNNQVQLKMLRKITADSAEQANRIFAAQTVDFDLEPHELVDGRDAAIVVEMNSNRKEQFEELKNGGIQYRLMEFEIGIPADFDIDVKTAAGHIESPIIGGTATMSTSAGHITLAGCTEKAEIRTSGGHLTIGVVEGDLVAKTAGGHIDVANVMGTAKLDAAGGHIKVIEADGAVDAHTSAGNIELAINKQPHRDIVLDTSAGNITVAISRKLQLDVQARCISGSISGSALPTGSDVSHADFLINDGGSKLKATTSIGNIELNYIEPTTDIPEI